MFVLQIKPDQTDSEPGWLSGECHGKEGVFPEAYAEQTTDETPTAQDAWAGHSANSMDTAPEAATFESDFSKRYLEF